MDETLLLSKSILEKSVLPSLQNNLLALDLMRKSGSDVENETMLVTYSPEPSIIKSIESHSFINNTTLESLFPRGCQDNRLRAKSLKESLSLSKTGNHSMNETLKNSPKNAMRRKLEINEHKMDLSVNLTFNDTDKEISLSESGSKTNPFVKRANCKKYSVNLNLSETTQFSSDILGTISNAENSLTEKPSANVFKSLHNIKYSPVIDLSLIENSEIEEEVRHPILASRRRSNRYSVKIDLDSSCDSLKNKTFHTNNFSILKSEDKQFDLIPNKKIIDLKETCHDETTEDKENQSLQIETPPCDSRRNGKVCSSSRKPKGKNSNQIGSVSDAHKINALVVNSTNDEGQTTVNTENVSTPTIECVEPSSRINKTGLEKEKSVNHKTEETKLNKSKYSKEVKCILKKDSMGCIETHIMDSVQNINEEDNSSQEEIPYLSKTITDEFNSTSTGRNLVMEELNLITSSLETNKELQDENERENVISTPNKCTIDDNNKHTNYYSNGVKSLENNNEVSYLQAESQVDVISIQNYKFDDNNKEGNDSSNEVKTISITSQPSKQVSSQKSKTNMTNEAVNKTTPAKRTRSSTRKSKMSDKTKNTNDKLAQKDIHQHAKEGEQRITESDSHSGNSTKSKFKLAKCSMLSANDENDHVRTLVENIHPDKDICYNFALLSLPSKQVSSRKSKANMTNVAVNETKTPTKRNRSSTRKSKMGNKIINNLSYDTSLDARFINQSFPHKNVLIYHSTPIHKIPIKQSYWKAIYQPDTADNLVRQSNSHRSTRRSISVDQNNCIESNYNHDKSSVNEQFCTASTRSRSRNTQQKNSLLGTKDSFVISNSHGDFDATSIGSVNSLNLNSESITISQPPHLDPIEKLKIKTALNKNKRKQESVSDSKEITPKKRKVANSFKLPKLYKPAKWVNKNLYQFLEKSLSDKYRLKVRKVSEEFVTTLYHTYTLVIRGHTEPSLSKLKAKLKELGLCHTQLDFFLFVINYMPFDFRKLVVPLSGTYTPIQPKILPFDEL